MRLAQFLNSKIEAWPKIDFQNQSLTKNGISKLKPNQKWNFKIEAWPKMEYQNWDWPRMEFQNWSMTKMQLQNLTWPKMELIKNGVPKLKPEQKWNSKIGVVLIVDLALLVFNLNSKPFLVKDLICSKSEN